MLVHQILNKYTDDYKKDGPGSMAKGKTGRVGVVGWCLAGKWSLGLGPQAHFHSLIYCNRKLDNRGVTETSGSGALLLTRLHSGQVTFFFFWWLHHMACRILVPQPGIEPVPPILGAQSLNN